EPIAAGTVRLEPALGESQLGPLCQDRARRSLVRCLTVSAEDRPVQADPAEVVRLQVAGPVPVVRGGDGGPREAAGGVGGGAGARGGGGRRGEGGWSPAPAIGCPARVRSRRL